MIWQDAPASVLITVVFDGQATVGASSSFTVTVNEHVVVEVFPEASVPVSVTVVTPLLNVTRLLGEPFPKPVRFAGLPIGLPEKAAFHVNGPAQLSNNVGDGIEYVCVQTLELVFKTWLVGQSASIETSDALICKLSRAA